VCLFARNASVGIELIQITNNIAVSFVSNQVCSLFRDRSIMLGDHQEPSQLAGSLSLCHKTTNTAIQIIMMKYTISLLLLATATEAFVVSPPGQHSTLKRFVQGKVSLDVETVRKEWKEQAEHLRAMENSIDQDHDLDGLVEHTKKTNKIVLEKEAHVHDSLISEIEHALETDPDLANIVTKKEKKRVNRNFMEKEKHMHDSLLTEVEHAIDTDPDLSM